jgi:hypothetical protein
MAAGVRPKRASAAIRTPALVQVNRSSGQTVMSGNVNPDQYEPSSKRRSLIQLRTIRAFSRLPMAASASANSDVSARVTQGRSETQRTPKPSTTNFLQPRSIRRWASKPVTAPARTG